ncbi:hypothetical protein J5N97_029648 [Dioscorea zingiberensis]|uniref:DNA 3'-5' helicase n=1 Tax=Dioscorea zingiberensis TaxID=325984 RepID=A0A9D5BWB6_9LILI|nr:hypothetical protein J5N97_029648 [Dioscorea zingiberensis]
MDKENLIAGDSRITSSYRAAKPHLLTRKRPYESLSPIPFSRSPLISSISLSSGPSSSYLLLDLLFNGSRCSNVIRVPLSEVQASDQPIKVPPAPSALDDELDDSFLQEIDAICEQNSAVKEQRPQKHGGVVMDKYSEYLQKLNDEQREAACADIAVPLMIIAGPGSGKTSTMVGRVLTLLQEAKASGRTPEDCEKMGDKIGSIYSFNGADICGFSSFREDFPTHKEIRLKKNYRSTGCIVEAASSLIYNNANRCKLKQVVTDNSIGSKIIVKECHSEDTECAYIVDKILEITSENSTAKCSFGNIAILYRRQVSGKAFQMSFRNRNIPFNVHGVAFYRKKVIRAIMSILKTTLPGCDDNSFQRAFKALLPCDKEEKKKIIEYVEKVSTVRNCSFISAAGDIFAAKISGTFKRTQLTHGRKVLSTLRKVYLGGHLFYSKYVAPDEESKVEEKGCLNILKAFIDYISERETENFRSRRQENGNSVTLTTIHQSKGLEWDVVFIVKANDSEIPLLHEFNGIVKEGGSTLEAEAAVKEIGKSPSIANSGSPQCEPPLEVGHERTLSIREFKNIPSDLDELTEGPGNIFLKRFKLEDRTTVSHLFHQWAKKSAFQHPKRLLDKVCFVIDERLRNKLNKHKDTLRALKSCLNDDEAFQYAQYVLRWEKIPIDKRIHLMREKQEHFQKQRIETSMGSLEATPKQIAYLHSLGCTIVPTSRLHASRLIEQYKSL